LQKQNIGGDERAWRKPEAHRQNSLPFSRLTRIGRRIFRSTKASLSCNNLSAAAMSEHTNFSSSRTRSPLVDMRGRKARGARQGQCEHPWACGARHPRGWGTSLGAAPLGAPMLAPCLTKSCSKPLMSSVSWGRPHPP
jgi:hypothetical protein